MLIKVKGFNYTAGTISIELTKNDDTSLALDKASKPTAAEFKLQRISGADLVDITISAVDFQSGSEPTAFDGLFKLTFTKTGVTEGDILVIGGGTPQAPFERIYNTVTIDTGLGAISETADTAIIMVAPNHNHTEAKTYNLVLNNLTELGTDVSTTVIPLTTVITVNGIDILSVKLTKTTAGDAFNKGDKIGFKVTFHSDAGGTSVPLNFDGNLSDYLAVGFDYIG